MTLTRKIEKCVDVLKTRKLDILGLSETKWKGQGSQELRDGYYLYWSGGEKAINGVAIILSHQMKERVVNVQNVSDRIIQITLNIDQDQNINLIQCYAPQTGLSDEEKEKFEDELDNRIGGENNIIMGDLNAQVGSNRLNYEEVLGPHGYGTRNIEGEKLLDLCTRNNLIMGNSWFMKKESHKITRYGWDGVQKSVIDYFITNREMMKRLNDVKVIPSVHLSSDHRLLVSTFTFDTLKEIRITQDKKLRVWKLKDPSKMYEYQDILRQNLPQTNAETTEEEWKKFKSSIIGAAEKVCGRTSNKRRWKETPWWNDTVRAAVLEKNKMFRQYFRNRTNENKLIYQRAKKEAEKIVEAERKKWMNEWSNTLSEDFDGNKKIMYGMIKNKRRTKEYTRYVVDNNGSLQTEDENIKEVWREYFERLLNIDSEDQPISNNSTETVEEEEFEITWNDIEYALKHVKTGKAPGVDEISGELIKYAGIVGKHWLYILFKRIWDEKQIPSEWREGIIIPLHKKGDRKKCSNYRGITLTSQVAKLFERIIERKIRPLIEPLLAEEQYGFRSGRSTIDLVFAIRQLMEKYFEYNKALWLGFLDIKKCFDSINRDKVWEALKRNKIEKNTITRIQNMYDGITSKVKTPVGLTSSFRINSGLRQGGVLSPLLFIMTMNEIQREVKDQIGENNMNIMLFADDICIWGDSAEAVQQQINSWVNIAEKYC
ncbi:hypothetical protein M8J77_002409 [Diaphorina citri]|nr:hypothetical protein M8J77_002409 [Diaphorina citri]